MVAPVGVDYLISLRLGYACYITIERAIADRFRHGLDKRSQCLANICKDPRNLTSMPLWLSATDSRARAF